VICEPWSVIVVPFPFTDRPTDKRRPTLVISTRSFNQRGHSVLAMITTKAAPAWIGDTRLRDHTEAGLPVPSLVRLKLFTLDNRLIQRKAGTLSRRDRLRVASSLTRHLIPA
jgi:mRNA interferase MazF